MGLDIPPDVTAFGQLCPSKNPSVGFVRNPRAGAIMEVPKAGCARFWIAFEFGKFLTPQMRDTLDLLAPCIVKSAQEYFGVSFVQGCYLL